MAITPTLNSFCTARGIRVCEKSRDVLVFKNVPVDVRCTTKPKTNLCVARESKTGYFVVWVDSDLRPRSPDSPTARLLTGMVKGNWQLVAHPLALRSAEQAVVETVQGLNGELSAPPSARERLLSGDVLPGVARWLDLNEPRPPLLHRDAAVELASRLMVSGLGSVVLAGPSGSGLTACAVEVLARHTLTERAGPTDSLAGIEPQHRYVVRVDCALIATEMLYPASSDERVRRLMADCLAEPDVYYLFDNVQWALGAGPLAQAAVVAAIERGLRCVATLQTDVFRSTRMLGTLARRTHWIELSALERAELLEILSCRARTIAAGCGIRVEPQAITSCLELSSRGAGAEPGRCLSLLEGAAALVLGSSAGRIGPDEVAAAARALVPIEH